MTDALQRSEQQILSDAARCQGSQEGRGSKVQGPGTAAAQPSALSPRPSRTGWEVATEQLRDLTIVASVLVPRAIATFRLKDCEATRDGILAAACCALKGDEPPKLFTFLVKRRAWETSGMDGIAEQHFDEVTVWKRKQEELPRADESGDSYFRGLSDDQELERHRAALIAQLRSSGLGGGG